MNSEWMPKWDADRYTYEATGVFSDTEGIARKVATTLDVSKQVLFDLGLGLVKKELAIQIERYVERELGCIYLVEPLQYHVRDDRVAGFLDRIPV